MVFPQLWYNGRMDDHDGDIPLADVANQLQQRLLGLVGAIVRTQHQGARMPDMPVELNVRLKLEPGNQWRPTADHVPLYRQFVAAIDEVCADSEAFQPGRVYCHRIHTAHSADALPRTPTSVFAGYSSTGMPEWKEFHQFVLDAGDERIHSLFASTPGVISIVTQGRVLKSRMITSLGKSSRSYNILGQVASGYHLFEDEAIRERLAVTLQMVECRAPGGLFGLQLNVIGVTSRGELAADIVARQAIPAIWRACQAGRREAQKIERAVRLLPADAPAERRNKILGHIPAVLTRMGEMLEQAGRQAARRTRHATVRKDEMRPVQCALDDATRAADAAIYVDEVNETRVVRGPRNRIHVFSANGRHVTTFTLRAEQIDMRIRTKYWRLAEPGEIEQFRQSLSPQVGQE